jgi:hypothetical protein
MRKAQWTGAVIVLAVIVFALTFLMNYTSGKRTGEAPPPRAETLHLWFVNEDAGRDAPLPPTEVRRAGYWDYWFENRNDRDLPVGLAVRKPPCCLPKVELFRVQEAERPLLAAALAGRVGLPGGPGVLPALVSAAAGEACVQAKVQGVELTETAATGVSVPARGVGWVRVHWNAPKVEELSFAVGLWTDQKGNEGRVLRGLVRILPALRVVEELDAGVLGAHDLPKRLRLHCFSETRDDLAPIKVEVNRENYRPESDPFQVSQPERLSEAEQQAMEEEASRNGKLDVHVRCMYRLWVTVRDASPDGSTPMDMGAFERSFTLSCANEPATEQTVRVFGKVEGEVSVGAGTSDGIARLGPFKASTGTRFTVTLESDVPDLELEVDKTRVPSFLEMPRLVKKPGEAGHKVWNLLLRVPAGANPGRFPDPSVDARRDSAVYVKTIYPKGSGKPSRSIRIPLSGVANNS